MEKFKYLIFAPCKKKKKNFYKMYVIFINLSIGIIFIFKINVSIKIPSLSKNLMKLNGRIFIKRTWLTSPKPQCFLEWLIGWAENFSSPIKEKERMNMTEQKEKSFEKKESVRRRKEEYEEMEKKQCERKQFK